MVEDESENALETLCIRTKDKGELSTEALDGIKIVDLDDTSSFYDKMK